MIISVSRRTDVPAYYSKWFFNRLEEGHVLVRNPMNHQQVSRVRLDKDVVDCFVFWTKNPEPMLSEIDRLEGYDCYFSYSLNPYGKPVENSLPDMERRIISFRKLSERLGPKGVVWRYDPIILAEEYDLEYHVRQFKTIASALEDTTDTCVFSFMRPYPKIQKRISGLGVKKISNDHMLEVIGNLVDIGTEHGIQLESCSETLDYKSLGIQPSQCIDDRRISAIMGTRISVEKDKNQREACGCVKSIDIGSYNTCYHDCLYCYANFSPESVRRNAMRHDVKSPFLIGGLEPEDKVTDRTMELYRGPEQLELEL